jgi:valyl-tRNA synthetase
MQEFIHAVRALRSELQIPIERRLSVVLRPAASYKGSNFIEENKGLIASFIGAENFKIDRNGQESVASAIPVSGMGFEAFVFVQDALDIEGEIKRVTTDLEKNRKALEGSLKKLANEKFLANAKPEAVEKEKSKRAEFEEKIAKGESHLSLLASLNSK